MSVGSLLCAARALIARPEHWCQGSSHRLLPGGIMQWCAYGAVVDAASDAGVLYTVEEVKARILLNELTAPNGFIRYNDDLERTHADILRLFDQAIERAERLQVTHG